MSQHDHVAQEEEHMPGGPGATQHAHPSAKEYALIAVVLTVITAIEVAVFYVPQLKPFLAAILLTLSALKFGIVALWYMHLKFDPKLYSWVFVVPMIFAAGIILALVVLLATPRG